MKLTKFAKKTMSQVIEAAKNQETLTYGELAKRLGQPGKTLCLPKVLGHISEYTYEEIGIFLTAIVVNQDTRLPGRGFQQLASLYIGSSNVLDEEFSQKHIKNIFSLSSKALDNLMLVGTK